MPSIRTSRAPGIALAVARPPDGLTRRSFVPCTTTVADSAALAALVQCVAKLEAERPAPLERLGHGPEVLSENRFLAARDGMNARLIDAEGTRRLAAHELLDALVRECEPHARALGCEEELAHVAELARCTGAQRQLNLARAEGRLPELVALLADAFVEPEGRGARTVAATPAGEPAPRA